MDIIAELFLLDMRVLEQQQQQDEDDLTVATQDDHSDDEEKGCAGIDSTASVTNTEDDETVTTTTRRVERATTHHHTTTRRELKQERLDKINQRVFIFMGVAIVGFFVILVILALMTGLFESTDGSMEVGEEQQWP